MCSYRSLTRASRLPCPSSPSTHQSCGGSTTSCHLRRAADLSSSLSSLSSYGRSWRKAARMVWSWARRCGPAIARPQRVGGRESLRPPPAPTDERRSSWRAGWPRGGGGRPSPSSGPPLWVTYPPSRVTTCGAAMPAPGPSARSSNARSPLHSAREGQARRAISPSPLSPSPPPSPQQSQDPGDGERDATWGGWGRPLSVGWFSRSYTLGENGTAPPGVEAARGGGGN